MHVKICTFAAAVVLLASCDAPVDVSDMRTTIQERLVDQVAEAPVAGEKLDVLTEGFAPALRSAVAINEGYLAALALEDEAKGQVGVAASVRRPQLIGSANIGGVRATGASADTIHGAAGAAKLSQLIYDGGASASAMNRTTAMALSAQAARVVQGNEIALRAAQAWISLWQYSERLRLIKARTSEMTTLVEQIERMARNGMLDKASLENAQRQIVDIKLEESRLVAGQAEAQILFQRFFNTKITTIPEPPELLSATQAKSLAQDWQTAPSLQRHAANSIAAQAAVQEAQSAFKPRAMLQASVQSPLESRDSVDLTIGLSLEYSFNDGGRRKNLADAAEERLEASNAQLRDAQRSLEAELKAGLTRLASIERALLLLADRLRLSRSEADTARSQMLTGQSNLRQLVEAEIDIYRAQDQQIAMQAERQVLLLTIAARTGALSRLVGLED